ncbi:MAG: hypothetical protein GY773_13575, partial [Actinomycetia bacterium]|nr:hypothetical protein [Actinomycetes bacterium]
MDRSISPDGGSEVSGSLVDVKSHGSVESREAMLDGLARDRGQLVDFLRGVGQDPALDGQPSTIESEPRYRSIALIEDDD